MPKITAIVLLIVAGLLFIAGASAYAGADEVTGISLIAASFGALIYAALFASLAEILSCLREIRRLISRPKGSSPVSGQDEKPMSHSGPRWRVTGLDKGTGFETSIVVKARSRRHAREVAQDQGLNEVTSIDELA